MASAPGQVSHQQGDRFRRVQHRTAKGHYAVARPRSCATAAQISVMHCPADTTANGHRHVIAAACQRRGHHSRLMQEAVDHHTNRWLTPALACSPQAPSALLPAQRDGGKGTFSPAADSGCRMPEIAPSVVQLRESLRCSAVSYRQRGHKQVVLRKCTCNSGNAGEITPPPRPVA